MSTNEHISVEVTFSRELTEEEQRTFMQNFTSLIELDTLYHGGDINSGSFNITIDTNESKIEKKRIEEKINNYLSTHNDIVLKYSIE